MRLIVTLPVLVSLTAGVAAQAQRPVETRSVPIDLLCAPLARLTEPSTSPRIVSGTEPARSLFAPGERVIVNAGAEQGIKAGQKFFVRRITEDRFAIQTTEKAPRSIHTAGWITIVDARDNMAVATVTHACDGILEGD